MRRVYSLLLALVAFFAIGCGSSFNPDGFFPDDPIPPGADASYLRVANLSPDSAALEFYLDDERLSTRNFEEFSNYFKVEAGFSELEVYEDGALVHSAELNLPVNGYQTFAVYDFVAQAKSSILTDSFYDGDESLGRLFHTVPDVPALSLTDQDGNVLLGPVAFGEVTEYIEVDVDDDEVDFTAVQLRTHEEGGEGEVLATYTRLRGSDTSFLEAIDSQTDEVNVTLVAAGDRVTSLPLIAALDQAELGGFTLVADPDEVQIDPILRTVHVRVMHADVDEADTKIDVYLDDAEVLFVSDLAYQRASGYELLTVEEGADSVFRVRASDAADGDDDLYTLDHTFGEADYDGYFTLTVLPEDQDDVELVLAQVVPVPNLILTEDQLPSGEPLQALLSFTHAVPNLGPVRLAIREGTNENLTYISNYISFGEVGTYQDVASLIGVADDDVLYVVADVPGVPEMDYIAAVFTNIRDQETSVIDALLALFFEKDTRLVMNAYLTGEFHSDDRLTAVGLVNEVDGGSESLTSDEAIPE